jgi:hypothetical protein
MPASVLSLVCTCGFPICISNCQSTPVSLFLPPGLFNAVSISHAVRPLWLTCIAWRFITPPPVCPTPCLRRNIPCRASRATWYLNAFLFFLTFVFCCFCLSVFLTLLFYHFIPSVLSLHLCLLVFSPHVLSLLNSHLFSQPVLPSPTGLARPSARLFCLFGEKQHCNVLGFPNVRLFGQPDVVCAARPYHLHVFYLCLSSASIFGWFILRCCDSIFRDRESKNAL